MSTAIPCKKRPASPIGELDRNRLLNIRIRIPLLNNSTMVTANFLSPLFGPLRNRGSIQYAVPIVNWIIQPKISISVCTGRSCHRIGLMENALWINIALPIVIPNNRYTNEQRIIQRAANGITMSSSVFVVIFAVFLREPGAIFQ